MTMARHQFVLHGVPGVIANDATSRQEPSTQAWSALSVEQQHTYEARHVTAVAKYDAAVKVLAVLLTVCGSPSGFREAGM